MQICITLEGNQCALTFTPLVTASGEDLDTVLQRAVVTNGKNTIFLISSKCLQQQGIFGSYGLNSPANFKSPKVSALPGHKN